MLSAVKTVRHFQVNTLDSYLTNKTNRLPSQVDGLQSRTIHTINRHILTECEQIEQKINCNPLKLTTIHSDPALITKKRGTYAGARINDQTRFELAKLAHELESPRKACEHSKYAFETEREYSTWLEEEV